MEERRTRPLGSIGLRTLMIRAMGGLCVLVLLAGTAYIARWFWKTRDSIVLVDVDKHCQTMRGWEATARMWEYDKEGNRYSDGWETYSEEIYDCLVNDLGVDRIRIEIRSGAENPVDYWSQFTEGKIGYQDVRRHFYDKVNDNSDPGVADSARFQFSFIDHQVTRILRPIQRLVAKNGEKLLINLCYVDFKSGDQGSLDHAGNPDEYAELIVATFQHLERQHGIVPDMFEMILEPDNSLGWRGKQIGEALVAVSRRLAGAGFEPRFIAPSTSYADRAVDYLDGMLAVPGVKEKLATFAYHRYGLPASLSLPGILERAREHGLETAMLEHISGDATELHEDLTVADASAWQRFSIAGMARPGQANPTPYCVVDEAASPGKKVRLSGHARYLAQYFKHVRVGAVRLGSSTDNSAKDPVAFLNPDGSHVLVVNSNRRGRIEIQGLPAGRYRPTLTTEERTAEALPLLDVEAGKSVSLVMPATGVLTLKQEL